MNRREFLGVASAFGAAGAVGGAVARPYAFTPRVAASRSLRFVVTPYNCWMKPGESIATNWKVYT